MKTATVQNHSVTRHMAAYPNAATRHQIIQKCIDLMLVFAIGTGFAAILLFLLALA